MMEVEVVEKEEKKRVLKVTGTDHTIMNLLCSELHSDEDVVFAAYREDHPLTKTITFYIQTSGKTPEKAIKDAIARIQRQIDEFEEKFKKALK
ncbi:MAG: RpoL/Rpb11 RNA polymerase subunit family protein [Candidatus Hadarchaeales archaeon]